MHFSDWNILTGEDIKTIASSAPTSIDELTTLGILGEKKVEEYGARIVKKIKLYVEKEELEHHLASKRTTKRSKQKNVNNLSKLIDQSTIIEIEDDDDDDDDEFESGIDYDAINLQSF